MWHRLQPFRRKLQLLNSAAGGGGCKASLGWARLYGTRMLPFHRKLLLLLLLLASAEDTGTSCEADLQVAGTCCGRAAVA